MAKEQGKVASAKSAIVAALPRACQDETAAVELFEAMRWRGEPNCPHCGDTAIYQMRDRKTGQRNRRFLWRCKGCGKQFTVRVASVYEDSPIPMRHWAYAFWAACASKKGVSAMQIQRQTGLTYKSALFLMHRVRFAMAEDYSAQPKMSGTIEADETYVGGKPRHKQPHKGPAVGWLDHKLPVVSLVERGGKVRSFVTPRVTAANLTKLLVENVAEGSHLMTDNAWVYRNVGKPFASHEVTDHRSGEYVRGNVYSNTVEGVFSLLKRGIYGTFHSVSRKHLHRYVAEFDFRYNSRKIDDGARTALAIRQAAGKRLRYREPVAVSSDPRC
jgi:transposase-like protein